MEDGRAGGAVEVFWSGDGFGPEFASVEVVANEAIGTEVDVEMLVVGDGSGCGGAVEVVDWFDGDFGRSATPEEAAGLSVDGEGDKAVGFECGEEKFITGNDGRGMTGWNRDFP